MQQYKHLRIIKPTKTRGYKGNHFEPESQIVAYSNAKLFKL